MKVFQKLLDSVKAQFPSVITEEVYSDMMQEYDAGIEAMQADFQKKGQAAGFQEGYNEGKRVAAEQAKAEMNALIQKLDQEAVEKLQAIVQMLDENHTQKLEEVYQYLTNTMVSREAHEAALAAQDEDHACKLEEIEAAINDDHTAKLIAVKEACDKACQAKLMEQAEELEECKAKEIEQACERIQKECEEKVKEEEEKKIETIAESVEKYLNYALEEYRPKAQLINEQKYKSALNSLASITDILKVNTIIQEAKDGIFKDYENKLAAAKATQNKLLNEKIELTSQLNKKEAQLVLEEVCKKCAPGEARYLKTYFKNAASPKIIEESIEDVRASYKKVQSERRAKLQSEVKHVSSTTPSSVVTEAVKEQQKTAIVSESKAVQEPIQSEDALMDAYVKYLKK